MRSTTGNVDFERIYQDIRENLEEKELESGRRKNYEERYQWPLLLAILLLLLEMSLKEKKGTSKGSFKEKKGFFSLFRPAALVFFFCSIGFPESGYSWFNRSQSKSAEGENLYQERFGTAKIP